MKISKLFHWLYALVMLMPLIIYLVYVVLAFANGWTTGGTITTTNVMDGFNAYVSSYFNYSYLGLRDVFNYIVVTIFGFSGNYALSVVYLLSYWAFFSIAWLIYDVMLYVPLLVHRWLDKGVLE